MEFFRLSYIFYLAKLAIQAYVYFASPNTTIYFAAGVAILSVIPLSHVIGHWVKRAPLSDLIIYFYLCLSFVLAFLWFEPTKVTKLRGGAILAFALVTTSDLLVLFVFCLHKLFRKLKGQGPEDPEVAHAPNAIQDVQGTVAGPSQMQRRSPTISAHESVQFVVEGLRRQQATSVEVPIQRTIEPGPSGNPPSFPVQEPIQRPFERELPRNSPSFPGPEPSSFVIEGPPELQPISSQESLEAPQSSDPEERGSRWSSWTHMVVEDEAGSVHSSPSDISRGTTPRTALRVGEVAIPQPVRRISPTQIHPALRSEYVQIPEHEPPQMPSSSQRRPPMMGDDFMYFERRNNMI